MSLCEVHLSVVVVLQFELKNGDRQSEREIEAILIQNFFNMGISIIL